MKTEVLNRTVQEFRRFNRFHTRLMGLFNKRLLGMPATLAEARLIYEISAEPGIPASDLAEHTGMDRGQVSRIITGLIKDGLVDRKGKPSGRKPLPLYLTPAGEKLADKLAEAADSHAAGLIGKLDERGAERLRGALAEARSLLGGEGDTAKEVRIREAGYADLGWIISRHGEVYGREKGFGDDFARYVLLGMAEYAEAGPARSRVWIAEAGGMPAGSVGIVGREGGRGQMRWLLVEPHARGFGLGRKLVETAVAFSRGQGFKEIFLWTVSGLKPAQDLYKSFGFVHSDSRPGTMGGVRVTEELWRLGLESD